MAHDDDSPRPHRGWYSRGYLPHSDHPGQLLSLTYRLADSLPAAVLEKVESDLRQLPLTERQAARRVKGEDWLDAGHGSCILRRPEAAARVVENWRHFAGERYDLIAWVVMPNHVHVLIRMYQGAPLARIVQSWKTYTARRIRLLIERAPQLAPPHPGAVWMRDYWDRYIRDERHFHTTVAYIHDNPVKAGLADRPEDWPWSSAREYDGSPPAASELSAS